MGESWWIGFHSHHCHHHFGNLRQLHNTYFDKTVDFGRPTVEFQHPQASGCFCTASALLHLKMNAPHGQDVPSSSARICWAAKILLFRVVSVTCWWLWKTKATWLKTTSRSMIADKAGVSSVSLWLWVFWKILDYVSLLQFLWNMESPVLSHFLQGDFFFPTPVSAKDALERPPSFVMCKIWSSKLNVCECRSRHISQQFFTVQHV